MRILLITDLFPRAHHPFTGISVYQTVAELKKRCNDIKIIHPIKQTIFPFGLINRFRFRDLNQSALDFLENLDITYPKYVQLPHNSPDHLNGHFLWFSAKKSLIKITREFKPDLIWAQTSIPCGWAAMKLSDKYNIPYMIMIHGWDFNIGIHNPKYKPYIHAVLDNANLIVAVSNRLKEKIKAEKETWDPIVINNAIDTDEIDSNTKSKKDEDKMNDPIEIVSVSNLVTTKGIEYNIKAIAEIIRNHKKNIHYTIVGDGFRRQKLEDLAKQLNVINRITFTGKLDHNEAMRMVAKADIFSLPSFKEGFGLVYLEAMYLEKPVIACRGEGPDDYIEDSENGLLVEKQDPHSLETALLRLIKDKSLRSKLGKNGRKTVLERFTWDKIIPQYESAFQKCISHK